MDGGIAPSKGLWGRDERALSHDGARNTRTRQSFHSRSVFPCFAANRRGSRLQELSYDTHHEPACGGGNGDDPHTCFSGASGRNAWDGPTGCIANHGTRSIADHGTWKWPDQRPGLQSHAHSGPSERAAEPIVRRDRRYPRKLGECARRWLTLWWRGQHGRFTLCRLAGTKFAEQRVSVAVRRRLREPTALVSN